LVLSDLVGRMAVLDRTEDRRAKRLQEESLASRWG